MDQKQRRRELQTILSNIPDVKKAYFQPKNDIKLEYPCIIYKRDSAKTIFADNSPYRNTLRYQVTVIDLDPESDIPSHVAALPMSTMVRHYTLDGLNHDIYNLYF